jgi:hypothetical protein
MDMPKFENERREREANRRREYEKVEQCNNMYLAAKALGFPEKISGKVEIEPPYHVIISVPQCFDPKVRGSFHSYPYDNTERFFYEVKLTAIESDSIYEEICSFGGEFSTYELRLEMSNPIFWLLICMKLFYQKDWDGKQWIDQKERFEYKCSYPDLHLHDDAENVLDMLTKNLAEKMAKQIDNEIMETMIKDPDNWKVQVGNTTYGTGDKVTIVNLPSINIKEYGEK